MGEIVVFLVGDILYQQFGHQEILTNNLFPDEVEVVDHWLFLHGRTRCEVLSIDLDVDVIDHIGCSYGGRLIDALALVEELFARAVTARDNHCGPCDVAGRRVVVHGICTTDAGLHAVVGHRGLDHIERSHSVIVDLDVLLTGTEQDEYPE